MTIILKKNSLATNEIEGDLKVSGDIECQNLNVSGSITGGGGFVDLTSTQTITGLKTFNNNVNVNLPTGGKFIVNASSGFENFEAISIRQTGSANTGLEITNNVGSGSIFLYKDNVNGELCLARTGQVNAVVKNDGSFDLPVLNSKYKIQGVDKLGASFLNLSGSNTNISPSSTNSHRYDFPFNSTDFYMGTGTGHVDLRQGGTNFIRFDTVNYSMSVGLGNGTLSRVRALFGAGNNQDHSIALPQMSALGESSYISALGVDPQYDGTIWYNSSTNQYRGLWNNTPYDFVHSGSSTGTGLNALAIHDGSVDNTNYSHLANTTSDIQGQLDSKADISSAQIFQNKSFIDDNNFFIDNLDNTKRIKYQLANISTGQTREFTYPDQSGALLTDLATQTVQNKTISFSNNTLTNVVSINTLQTITSKKTFESNTLGDIDIIELRNTFGSPGGHCGIQFNSTNSGAGNKTKAIYFDATLGEGFCFYDNNTTVLFAELSGGNTGTDTSFKLTRQTGEFYTNSVTTGGLTVTNNTKTLYTLDNNGFNLDSTINIRKGGQNIIQFDLTHQEFNTRSNSYVQVCYFVYKTGRPFNNVTVVTSGASASHQWRLFNFGNNTTVVQSAILAAGPLQTTTLALPVTPSNNDLIALQFRKDTGGGPVNLFASNIF